MASPAKLETNDLSENQDISEDTSEDKLENYETCQLYETCSVIKLLDGIYLAGFCREDKYQESPPIKAFTQITDIKVGQKIDGKVASENRLGSFIDIGVGQDGFLHKANMKGHSLYLGSDINVEVTKIDLVKNKITLNLCKVLKNDKPAIDPSLLNVSSKMTCSVCSTDFESRDEQVQHYKLDWHRYNLKQKIIGEVSVSEEAFDKLANDDELSSLSGSDSKSDEEEEESANDSNGYSSTSGSEAVGSPRRKLRSKLLMKGRLPRRERSDSVTSTDTECEDERAQTLNNRFQPKLYLCNNKGNVVALYRCVVHGKQNTPEQQGDLLRMVQAVPSQMKWAIILLGGGHFAAAVFEGEKSILHKTFHRYTCRAKQGGSQGAQDSKGGAPKSGGATLRRYNEAALIRDIQNLMATWSEDLQACHRIFYRAAGINRSTLIGGKNSTTTPFKKTDPRLRTIPFPTRRATYKEVQRVHKMLSTLECFGDHKLYEKTIPQSPKIHLGNKSPKKSFSKLENSSKNRLISLPTKLEVLPDEDLQNENIDPILDEDETDLTLVEEIHNLNDLKPFDQSKRPKKKKGKRKTSLPRHQESPISTPIDGEEYQFKTALYSACKAGNVEKLLNLLKLATDNQDNHRNNNHTEEKSTETLDNSIPTKNTFVFSLSLLNEPFGEGGSTFLHVAAKEGHKDLVKILMEHGASPCIKNKAGHTPYILTEDKETRKEFRKFWDANPDKFDYSQSKIPGPLSEEQEKEQQAKQAERNKERKKVKKERLKDKKVEIAIRKAEEEERKRYLALSDREKRALAAERRLMAEASNTPEAPIVTISRCFLCGSDITGKVPFEYNNCRFCSIKCVKEHRKK